MQAGFGIPIPDAERKSKTLFELGPKSLIHRQCGKLLARDRPNTQHADQQLRKEQINPKPEVLACRQAGRRPECRVMPSTLSKMGPSKWLCRDNGKKMETTYIGVIYGDSGEEH